MPCQLGNVFVLLYNTAYAYINTFRIMKPVTFSFLKWKVLHR